MHQKCVCIKTKIVCVATMPNAQQNIGRPTNNIIVQQRASLPGALAFLLCSSKYTLVIECARILAHALSLRLPPAVPAVRRCLESTNYFSWSLILFLFSLVYVSLSVYTKAERRLVGIYIALYIGKIIMNTDYTFLFEK